MFGLVWFGLLIPQTHKQINNCLILINFICEFVFGYSRDKQFVGLYVTGQRKKQKREKEEEKKPDRSIELLLNYKSRICSGHWYEIHLH